MTRSVEVSEVATCRGCQMVLRGKAYYMGGRAYHPRTGKQCPANFYGGFVCSPECDRRASLSHEQTMPGHSYDQRRLSCHAQNHHNQNWGAHG